MTPPFKSAQNGSLACPEGLAGMHHDAAQIPMMHPQKPVLRMGTAR
jgi:hypothetical protein